MQFFSNLAKSPVETLDTWQKTRYPWAIMAATMAGLVLVAHFVFQEWLYMAPCEQCVYIRYGNLVMALGGLIALINPRILALRLAAYAVSFYGLIYTMICSWKLMAIHDAVHSDDPAATFGIQGCSAEAHYPFDLPLAQWAPGWFQQTGDCGYDSPIPPEGVDLSGLRGSSSICIKAMTAGILSRNGTLWTWQSAACSPVLLPAQCFSLCLLVQLPRR